MNTFWEDLNIRLAAPRKKKEESVSAPSPASVGPLEDDGYSYLGSPNKDEYYFDGPHPTARLGKGSWKSLRDGTEVFVDQKGNVRAGGKYTWHGQPFDAVNKEHTRALASLSPEERTNLQPIRPSGKFLRREDGSLKIDPEIRTKYLPQLQQNYDWAVDKKGLKDRVAARMMAENNQKVDNSNGISFFPFKNYSPAHQDALAAAHANQEKLGDLASISDPSARATWAQNHAANLDGLSDALDTANLGDGYNLVGSRADLAKQYAAYPSLLDTLPINSNQNAVAPTVKNQVKPSVAPGISTTPELAPKRSPRKTAPSTVPSDTPTTISAPPPSKPSGVVYPKGKNIIQDDLSSPSNALKRPTKNQRNTYYMDPRFRSEKLGALTALKLIIKNGKFD